MTTLADLRERLRLELHDTGGERWDDEALDRHISRAVNDLSLVAPRQQRTTLTTVPASRDLDISALDGLVCVFAVEYPAGSYPASYVQYSRFGDVLTLLVDAAPAAAEDVTVYWGSLHEVDDEGSTLPPAYEDLVLTGAAGYAGLEWASFATNRANVSGADAFEDYVAWGREALERFQRRLQDLPEVRRVTTSRLYSPSLSFQREAVQWES